MSIPVLETERLRLRGWRKEDFPAYAAFWQNPERTQFFISGCLDRGASWQMFASMSGEWHLHGYGCFAIERKSDSKLVGHAGIWYPADIAEPELMWGLYDGFDGNGYATEAASRARNWANQEKSLPALMSFVHPDNLGSVAVAERLGATKEAETSLRGSPRLVFRHVLTPATAGAINPN